MFLLLHSAGSLLHSKGCLLTFRSGTDLCLNRKRKINTNKSAFQPNMKLMFDDVQNREYNTIRREGTNTNRRLNTLIGMFSVYLFPKNKKLFQSYYSGQDEITSNINPSCIWRHCYSLQSLQNFAFMSDFSRYCDYILTAPLLPSCPQTIHTLYILNILLTTHTPPNMLL